MAEINFFWDPLSDNILQERDAIGSLAAEYSTEPGLYGNIISQSRGGVESQFHFDALGSTLAVTNNDQHVTDSSAYSAFGEITEVSGGTDLSVRYIGRHGYRQCIVGDCHSVRRRTYVPDLIRWDSTDQYWSVFGASRYIYCRNNSTLLIDPSGLLEITNVYTTVTPACGQDAFVAFRFKLNAPAPCEGYLVQEVTFHCRQSACVSCPDALFTEPTARYYEAWKVEENKDRPRREIEIFKGRRGNLYTDGSLKTFFDGTCGSDSQVGKVKFFCKDPNHPKARGNGTEDLENPQNGWAPWRIYGTEPCIITPGELISTGTKPSWWEGNSVEGPVTRTTAMSWKCCPCQDTYADIFATPKKPAPTIPFPTP